MLDRRQPTICTAGFQTGWSEGLQTRAFKRLKAGFSAPVPSGLLGQVRLLIAPSQ